MLKTISDIKDLKSKRVLVRADLNVPIQNGKIMDSTRIIEFLPTIDSLIKKHAKQIIILTHLGRPDGKFNEEFSLTPIYDFLKKKYKNIKFAKDFIDIDSSPLILFQNIRFFKGEEEDSKSFSKKLSTFGDVFIDDAFSVAHRKHASNYGITKFLPSYAGPLLMKEVNAIDKATENPKRPLTIIIGGAKLETKLPLVKTLLKKADTILVGGKIASQLKTKNPKIIKAIDYSDNTGYDIGPKTISLFKDKILKSKTIFFNGPLGYFEKKPYDKGTNEIVRLIAKQTKAGKLYSLIGGGETLQALGKYKKDISYCSLSGGALLEFIEKGCLPAIKVLQQ
ncbi:MAG: phosphoglycerate kinase [Prevotellaceae bacterium]|jgi:phosphoglycerate kinase|nr:phosphoglycerate kinase [Prevotellaceae bacterium]